MQLDAHGKSDYMLETPKSSLDYRGETKRDETMGNQQVTLNEIGWLAGIIDGEGYLGAVWETKKKYRYVRVQLHITNCDEQIILKAQHILRKIGINPYIRACKGSGKVKKDNFRVQIRNFSKLSKLLLIVMNDLTGNKKKRAELILELCESRLSKIKTNPNTKKKPYTKREIELVERCQPLVKRGTSETIRQRQRSTSEIWGIMRTRQLEAVKI